MRTHAIYSTVKKDLAALHYILSIFEKSPLVAKHKAQLESPTTEIATTEIVQHHIHLGVRHLE